MTMFTFLKIIRSRFFAPGFVIKNFHKEEKISKLLLSSGNKYNLTSKDVQHVQKFLCVICEIYLTIRLWIIGGILNHIFIYIFVSILLINLPIVLLKIFSIRRSREFEKQFEQIIDILIQCLNSGMNLQYAIEYSSQCFHNIVSNEFKILSNQIKLGSSGGEALSMLSQRINSDVLNRFIIILKQSQTLGSSLSSKLKLESDLSRLVRKQKAEEYAHKASVKMMLPLVLCIFPALLIIYLAPGIINFLALK